MLPETVIRSRNNPIYKQLRSLQRRDRRHQERAFLVEGPRFIADAIQIGAVPVRIAVSEDHVDSVELPLDMAQRTSVLDHELFTAISDTVSSQGAIAVFPFPDLVPDPDRVPLILVADGIQDPGNLGALIRSAAGAGATQVVTLPGTVDAWAPKTVRSAAGAHFVIPIASLTVDQLAGSLASTALVVGADARAAVAYDRVDLRGATYLVVGSEGNGLSDNLVGLVNSTVAIPLAANVESLNAAVAGSILLFEAARQRRLSEN